MYYTLVLVDQSFEVEKIFFTARTDIQWIADKLNRMYYRRNLLWGMFFAVLHSKRFEDYGRDAVVAEVSAWLEDKYL